MGHGSVAEPLGVDLTAFYLSRAPQLQRPRYDLPTAINQPRFPPSKHRQSRHVRPADAHHTLRLRQYRALEAFWQANPGLRLEVGDKLIVTEEFADYVVMHRLDIVRPRVNGLIAFKSVLLEAGSVEVGVRYSGIDWPKVVVIYLDIARRMRQAYLEAHPTE